MKTPKKGKKAVDAGAAVNKNDENLLELPSAAGKPKAKPSTKKAVSTTTKKVTAKTKNEAKVAADDKKAPAKIRKTAASSPVKKVQKAAKVAKVVKQPASTTEPPPPAVGPHPLASMSPVERLLSTPKLPALERENRARLQMQSPTKLHFYWSVRENPWAILRRAFGSDTGSYTLVLKLVEMRSGSEQIHNAEADGSWWFDVRPDGEYRAEIGFYAPNRPYIRIVYSNVINTPRLKPSPRKAAESNWTVSAHNFARVLDVSGFARDAFDVAVAGDHPAASATAARQALTQFAYGNTDKLAVVEDEDIRFAMLAFAEGQKLEELRWKISAELFDYLATSDSPLKASRAEAALRDHFDLEEIDLESEETGPAVFGASLVNFPRTVRSRQRPRLGTGPSPESSHSVGRLSRR